MIGSKTDFCVAFERPKKTLLFVLLFFVNYRFCMKTDLSLCPLEVSGASACCHGDDLYVFGGHGSQGNSNELYRLDLKTYTWHLLDPDVSPSPRDKAVSWFYEKKLVIPKHTKLSSLLQ